MYYDHLFKLVIVGDPNVGKTSMLTNYVDNSHKEKYVTTIGVDFRIKTLEIDGKIIKLQIWDTAGQDRFQSITRNYYRGASGAIIAFDLTNRNSFERVEHWVNQVNDNTDAINSPKMFLAGTKMDMPDHQVKEDEALATASRLQMSYHMTSSKTGQGITKMFDHICRYLIENWNPKPRSVAPIVPINNSCC